MREDVDPRVGGHVDRRQLPADGLARLVEPQLGGAGRERVAALGGARVRLCADAPTGRLYII